MKKKEDLAEFEDLELEGLEVNGNKMTLEEWDELIKDEVPLPLVTYFQMGHAEVLEGWKFAGGWGVRVDGVLEGVFTTESDAMTHASSRATELNGAVQRLDPV